MPAPDSTVEERGSDDEGTDSGLAPDVAPIEPGSPSLENAAFVLLGVLVALSIVFRLVQLFG